MPTETHLPREPSLDDFLTDSTCISEQLQDDNDVEACLETAIQYYHSELPEWLRAKITLKWGIEPDTIDKLRIGYVPEEDNLVEYLTERDFHPLTIARAGVASAYHLNYVYHYDPSGDKTTTHPPEPLRTLAEQRDAGEIQPGEIDIKAVYEHVKRHEDGGFRLWNGWDSRIIFPYYNADGAPRYLIGRETADTDDYAHKYAKLTIKRPYINRNIIDEPIYGTWSLVPGEPLILTEGITDAIMAHQADLPCLSPVAKQFKEKHHEPLAELCRDASIVYIVNDSETSGEGPKGAVKTGLYLDEQGLDVAIATLPRPENVDKVDLAEFLRTHQAVELEPILDDAVTPDQHPIYDELKERERTKARGLTPDPEEFDTDESTTPQPTASSDPSKSAIYELSLRDVIKGGTTPTYQTKRYEHNPLGPEGESPSKYFAIFNEGAELKAYTHKKNYGYNALTWMAVECDYPGTRGVEHPSGELSNLETWAVWTHAKDVEYIPSDDPVPRKAIWHIAEKHDLMPSEFIPSSWSDPELPKSVYNRALTAIREEEGYNPGRRRLDS